MAKKQQENFCSFCGKSDKEAALLLSGMFEFFLNNDMTAFDTFVADKTIHAREKQCSFFIAFSTK